jgi:hypothetical protein
MYSDNPARVGSYRAKRAQQPLRDRLEGCKAVTDFRGMNAGAHAVAVINGREDPHHAVVHGRNAHAVGSPHLIGAISRDPAVVKAGFAPRLTVRREQPVLAHQPQYAGSGDTDVVHDAQPRPDLAVPLAAEWRSRKIITNGLEQVGIAHLRLRSKPARNHRRHGGARSGTNGIDRRTREFEHLANPLQSQRACLH